MKRLTAISDVGEAYYPYCYRADTCDGEGGTEKCRDCEFSEKICKTLAAYENTGLTPEEIMYLKERDMAKALMECHYEEPGEEPYIKYTCPNGCKIQPSRRSKFCSLCGQRLKWED